ncbi:MAG: hypothetical protein HY399_07015 [Elusimicrobia bacterium]|nr:hypothetical protein [Elusimicrobiota bacterium]
MESLKKVLAGIILFSLLWTIPGIGAYQAVAQSARNTPVQMENVGAPPVKISGPVLPPDYLNLLEMDGNRLGRVSGPAIIPQAARGNKSGSKVLRINSAPATVHSSAVRLWDAVSPVAVPSTPGTSSAPRTISTSERGVTASEDLTQPGQHLFDANRPKHDSGVGSPVSAVSRASFKGRSHFRAFNNVGDPNSRSPQYSAPPGAIAFAEVIAGAGRIKKFLEENTFQFSTDYPSPSRYTESGSQARGLDNLTQPEGVKTLVEWLGWAEGPNKTQVLYLILDHVFNLILDPTIPLGRSVDALHAVLSEIKTIPADRAHVATRALDVLGKVPESSLKGLKPYLYPYYLSALGQLTVSAGVAPSVRIGLANLSIMALDSDPSYFDLVRAAQFFSSQESRDLFGLEQTGEFLKQTLLTVVTKHHSFWNKFMEPVGHFVRGVGEWGESEEHARYAVVSELPATPDPITMDIMGKRFQLSRLLVDTYIRRILPGWSVERSPEERVQYIQRLFGRSNVPIGLRYAVNRLESGFMYAGHDSPMTSTRHPYFPGWLGFYPSDLNANAIELDYRGSDAENDLKEVLRRHGLESRLIKSKVTGWETWGYWVDNAHIGQVVFIQAADPRDAVKLALQLAADPSVDRMHVRVSPLLRWRAELAVNPWAAWLRTPLLIQQSIREFFWNLTVSARYKNQIKEAKRKNDPRFRETALTIPYQDFS